MPYQDRTSRMPQYPKPIYNDGICVFFRREKKRDKYGTPIPGAELLVEVHREWFRVLGLTSEENFQARSLATDVSKRVAVKWFPELNSQYIVELEEKQYEIFRIYQNSKRDETEISLVESVGEELPMSTMLK